MKNLILLLLVLTSLSETVCVIFEGTCPKVKNSLPDQIFTQALIEVAYIRFETYKTDPEFTILLPYFLKIYLDQYGWFINEMVELDWLTRIQQR